MAKRQVPREKKPRPAVARKSDSETAVPVQTATKIMGDRANDGGESRQSQGVGQQASVFNQADFNVRVARRAYELFERRGGGAGHDVEDWLEAERQVKDELLRESPVESR